MLRDVCSWNSADMPDLRADVCFYTQAFLLTLGVR